MTNRSLSACVLLCALHISYIYYRKWTLCRSGCKEFMPAQKKTMPLCEVTGVRRRDGALRNDTLTSNTGHLPEAESSMHKGAVGGSLGTRLICARILF
jgi:hypothetical protein